MATSLSSGTAADLSCTAAVAAKTHDAGLRRTVSELASHLAERAAELRGCLADADCQFQQTIAAHDAETNAAVAPAAAEQLASALSVRITPPDDLAETRRRLADTGGDAAVLRTLLHDARAPLPAAVHSDSAAAGVANSLSTLRSLAASQPRFAPKLLQELRTSDESLQRLQRVADEMSEARRAADCAGNFAGLSEAQDAEAKAYSELVELRLERIAHLSPPGGVVEPSEVEAAASLEALQTKAAECRDKARQWATRATDDTETLQAALDTAMLEEQCAASAASARREASREALQMNAEAQMRIIGDVELLLGQLGELSRQRSHVLGDALQAEEEYQRVRAKHESVVRGAAKHRAVLEDTQARAEAMMEAVDGVEADGGRLHRAVVEAARLSREEVSSVLFSERRGHHRAFGCLYAVLGDCLHCQERREEELDAQADAAQVRLSLARDTLDPEGSAACAEKVVSLRTATAAAKAAAAVLRRKMDEAASEAVPTEEALTAAGEQVESPVEIVRADLADRAARAAATRRVAHVRRGEAVDAVAAAAAALRPPPPSSSMPLSPSAAVPPLTASPLQTHPVPPPQIETASVERRRNDYSRRLGAISSAPRTRTGFAGAQAMSPPLSHEWTPGPRSVSGSPPAASPMRGGSPDDPDGAHAAAALRRRAEELRRAAEESRRRAVLHRQQAEILAQQRQNQLVRQSSASR